MTDSHPQPAAGPEPFADQELADFIRGLAAFPPMTAGGDVAEMRRTTEERSSQRPPGPAMPTRDLEVDGRLPARLYHPGGARDTLVIYLHGGGWTIGSLETHDRACRRLAARAGVAVLAVDYRLAPEHPAPAAVDDTLTALRWAAGGPGELGFRPRVIALAGDSAGGALAELAALRTRSDAVGPDFVALAFPNTDLAAAGGSMVDNAHGYGLESADIAWFNRQWVPDRTRWPDPDLSPLRVEDLTGFPPTVIVTCELDPLRDQGEAFADRLRAAGVEVMGRREPGMVHNFLLWDLISPSCAAAGDRFADDVATMATTMLARRTGGPPR
jgi:acetyl esterase